MTKRTSSFEEKIKSTFTNYARVLMIILFAILVLFIGFERVMKPRITAYQLNRKVINRLSVLGDKLDNLMEASKEIIDNSTFYEVYYTYLIGQDLKGDLSVYNENGDILYLTNPSDQGSYLKRTYNRIVIENIEKSMDYKYTSSMKRTEDSNDLNEMVYGEKVFRKNRDPLYVVIYFDSDHLNQYVLDNLSHPIIISDLRHNVLASSSKAITKENNRFNLEDLDTLHIDDRAYRVNTTVYNNPKFRIQILTYVEPIPSVLGYISITLVLVLWIHQYASTKVARRVGEEASKAISSLQEVIDKVAQGEFGITVDLDTQDEFEGLARAFNTMSQELEFSTSRNKMLLEMQKLAEIKQLEAQFNPHFLYNSLETIRYLISSNPKLAESLILKNTQLLRYSIESQDELVHFRKDFKYINLYLDIHKIRLENALIINVDIDSLVYEEMLPRLLLQPLIENSIKHGFKHQDRLVINIAGYIENDNVIICVEDTGSGMDVNTLNRFRNHDKARLSSGSHYGLYSIHHRLSLIYKEQASMTINSDEDGTRIRLKMPRRTPHV